MRTWPACAGGKLVPERRTARLRQAGLARALRTIRRARHEGTDARRQQVRPGEEQAADVRDRATPVPAAEQRGRR